MTGIDLLNAATFLQISSERSTDVHMNLDMVALKASASRVLRTPPFGYEFNLMEQLITDSGSFLAACKVKTLEGTAFKEIAISLGIFQCKYENIEGHWKSFCHSLY